MTDDRHTEPLGRASAEREDQESKHRMNGWEAVNSIVGNIMTGSVIAFIVWVIYLLAR